MSAALLAPRSLGISGTLAVRSPAKLNLTLDILGRRSDGYHDLRSLVVGVDWCDHIRCSHSSSIEVECTDPSLSGPSNLAYRAAALLAERSGVADGVKLSIRKRIPIGGGLGGGSGDAAATLRACNELWECGLTPTELASLGAEIGSDVALFFSLPSAVMEGRGERVRKVRLRWSGWALLVYPPMSVSTAEVYRAWRRGDADDRGGLRIGELLDQTRADDLMPMLSNQLESAAFRVCPALGELFETLLSLGVGPWRMSGSGSTLYQLFDDPSAARHAAQRICECVPRVKTHVAAAPVGLSPVFSEES